MCPKTYTRKESLTIHLTSHVFHHKTELSDPLFCSCGRSYSGKHRKGNLRRHLSFECGVVKPTIRFKCDICPKTYTRKESLTMHHDVLKVASENDPAFCPNGCGRSYKGVDRKHNLKKHMMYACGVKPQFECNICFKKFNYKHCLKSHLINIHRNLSLCNHILK
ncbi:Krueppel homolog 1-like [Adelges cooleyi]|uniref:Krueppel homolog 1-like n=1 Tax=Adelges cooleyi TaxID=133065 RepID=UPI0021802AAF|nr:Krueppel homolog 1-like [Adelges cooleyi]